MASIEEDSKQLHDLRLITWSNSTQIILSVYLLRESKNATKRLKWNATLKSEDITIGIPLMNNYHQEMTKNRPIKKL